MRLSDPFELRPRPKKEWPPDFCALLFCLSFSRTLTISPLSFTVVTQTQELGLLSSQRKSASFCPLSCYFELVVSQLLLSVHLLLPITTTLSFSKSQTQTFIKTNENITHQYGAQISDIPRRNRRLRLWSLQNSLIQWRGTYLKSK